MRKVDNSNDAAKLSLRRYALDKWHNGGSSADVFDACQGSKHLWLNMDRPVRSYWGVDKKPKRGRLCIDASRVIGSAKANVFDIDTYGSPFEILKALVDQTKQCQITVFLTTACPLGSVGNISNTSKMAYVEMMGREIIERCPRQILREYENKYPQDLAVFMASGNFETKEVFSCESGKSSVKYIGLHLHKREVS